MVTDLNYTPVSGSVFSHVYLNIRIIQFFVWCHQQVKHGYFVKLSPVSTFVGFFFIILFFVLLSIVVHFNKATSFRIFSHSPQQSDVCE